VSNIENERLESCTQGSSRIPCKTEGSNAAVFCVPQEENK
jgi:hypothetical protein